MILNVLTILLLPAIFFIGIITSYEDIKYKKIRNKWVLSALLYSIFIFLGIFLKIIPTNEILSRAYLFSYFLNLIFAFFVGILIWVTNLWSAGDAKLFMAYAVLIYPIHHVQIPSVSFSILLNTFLPFLVFYVFKMLFKTSVKLKLSLLKSILKPEFLLNNLLFIFSFSWIGYVLMSYFNNKISGIGNVFTMMLFLFIVLFLFRNILKIDHKNLSIVVSSIALFTDFERIISLDFLRYFSLLFFIFIFVRHFIINLAFETLSYPIYIENLRSGMVIAENFSKEKGSYTKHRMTPLSFLSALIEKSEGKFLFPALSEGLTKKDAEEIKSLHSQGHIKEHTIRIFQTVPFAPFIFLGVLIALLIGKI
ncbi:prepilin peptidase [Candidatus Woesearchaeota archaeon]|nr:prepilin peptidase [Candidatus Woesearchaeota archaeon]